MRFIALDAGIVDSTIWLQPPDVLKLWIFLIATANRGKVRSAVPILASRNGLTIERTLEILRYFESPDPHSRTKDNEGRRVSIQWEPTFEITILNWERYSIRDTTAATRQRRFRERAKQANVTDSCNILTIPLQHTCNGNGLTDPLPKPVTAVTALRNGVTALRNGKIEELEENHELTTVEGETSMSNAKTLPPPTPPPLFSYFYESNSNNNIDHTDTRRGVWGEPIFHDKTNTPDPFQVIELYNQRLGHVLPAARIKESKSHKTRIAHIRARTRDFFPTIEDWDAYFTEVLKSPFLLGENKTGWRANIDWLIKPSNVAKVIEGNYTERPRQEKKKALDVLTPVSLEDEREGQP